MDKTLFQVETTSVEGFLLRTPFRSEDAPAHWVEAATSSEEDSSSSFKFASNLPDPYADCCEEQHYVWAGKSSSARSECESPHHCVTSIDIEDVQKNHGGGYGDLLQLSEPYSEFIETVRRESVRHADMNHWIKHIPLDENGALTSVGSIAHVKPEEKCKPCIFLRAACGCSKGIECPFCHMSHKFRMCKGKRDRVKRLLKKLGSQGADPLEAA
eukprot:s1718_g13.t1